MELSRPLASCILIAVGVGILAVNRTEWSLRGIEGLVQVFVGGRLAPYGARVMHYAYSLIGVLCIVLGFLLAIGVIN